MERFFFFTFTCVLFTIVVTLPKDRFLHDEESSNKVSIETVDEANKLLTELGFNPCEKPDGSHKDGPLCYTGFESMIESFQRTFHLPVTKRFDEATKKLMNTPRCGMIDGPAAYSTRHKLWPTNRTLTWKLDFGNSPINRAYARQIMQQSFDEWAKYTDLTFREVNGNEKADFGLALVYGQHGDGYSLGDGPGGVLAHAFLPAGNSNDGGVHFDSSDHWSDKNDGAGFNLKLVATHEIGHALGLEHSNNNNSLMFRFYHNIQADKLLPIEDQQTIQSLYGVKTRLTIPTQIILTRKPKPSAPTNDCSSRHSYNGQKYEGQCRNGMRHGRGAFTWSTGDIYDGNWVNDKLHGRGTYTWVNGDKYDGNWIDNQRTGRGLFISRNGDRYIGQFKDGKYHGFGKFVWADHGTYRGDYADGYMHGRGVRTWPDGSIFDGKFEQGKPIDGDMTAGILRNAKQANSQCPYVCRKIHLAWHGHWSASSKYTTSICRCVTGSTF